MICKGIAYQEKEIMIYGSLNSDKTYNVYTKEGSSKITISQYTEYKSKPRSCKYVLVKHDETETKSIKQFYDDFVDMANELKDKSKGKINMYKSGRISQTALKLLYDFMNETEILPEKIKTYENRFISTCGGAFRLGTQYKGKLYKYDYRSYFPSIDSSSKLLIPIKQGELKTLTQKQLDEMKYFDIGVYHCTIEIPTGDLKKLIWVNNDNFYTHYELTYIREKKLKITMIDEKDNFLYYKRSSCKLGSEIFKEYVDYVYKLKQDNVKGAKQLLNNLWGVICKKNNQKIIHDFRDGEFDLFGNKEVVNTIPLDENRMILYLEGETLFTNDLARMKPFFLAKCRLTMSKTIEPYIKDVYYCHTDSILSGIKLSFKDDGKLGNIRYEGYCKDGYVVNANQRSPNSDFIM